MENLIGAYCDFLKTEKRVSENTLTSYKADVEKYICYLEKRGMDLCAANGTHILEYMVEMEREGRSAATVSRMLAAVRSLYKYLRNVKLVDADPTERIRSLKIEKKLPEILTDSEVEWLLEQPDTDSDKGVRDKAMLELLYATGMRVSELIELKLSDADMDIGYINCRRGSEVRTVPVYSLARTAVKEYIDKVRSKQFNDGETEETLFLNCRGGKMTRQGFWKILKKYAESAGICKEITPHTLRHSFALNMVENGADLKFVQEMLGNADISSTQVYVNIKKKRMKEVYENAHPRAKKLQKNS